MSAASTLPRLKHSPRQTRAAVSSAQLLARRFSLPHDWRSSARIGPYANATLAARSIGGVHPLRQAAQICDLLARHELYTDD